MDEKCENCKFYRKQYCLRYPPKTFVVGVRGNTEMEHHFPMTAPNNFCGEFTPGEITVAAEEASDMYDQPQP